MEITAGAIQFITSEIVGTKKRHFRDLWFRTDQTDEAFSRLICRDCSHLRLRLPEGTALHLSSFRLWMRYGDKSNAPLKALRDVSLGSQLKDSKLQIEKILDFANNQICFHTTTENPSITLQFEPGYLHRLEINNRNDMFAARAWGLIIDISCDGKSWQNVFQHSSRAAEFRHTCIEYLGRTYPLPLVERISTIVQAAYEQPASMREALAEFARIYGQEMRSALATVVNAEVLKQRRLEITASHGPQETFRFWDAQLKRDYVAFAAEIISRLRANGNTAFLGYGTLLGMVRDGDMIAHDDDIDLVLVVDRKPGDTISDLMERFTAELTALDLKVIGNYPNHRHIGQEGRPKVLDVFLAIRDGDQIRFNPGKVSNVPTYAVEPLKETEFMGSTVVVPGNLLTFLECMYGPTWRTPLPDFHHNWKPLT